MAWPVLSVEEMRRLEAAAQQVGLDEAGLQQNAAREIAAAAATFRPGPIQTVVLVGPGNNGRDAFLAGRLLARQGYPLVYALGPRHAIRAEELAGLQPVLERRLTVTDTADLAALESVLDRSSLVLDGLLGIGVRGPMRPPLDSLASLVNRCSSTGDLQVISVDLPSGVDADSGELPGEAIRAALTVALGGVKAGLLRFPAANYVGRLEPRPIGLHRSLLADCRVWLLEPNSVQQLVPARAAAAHKGTLGWTLVIGGSRDYIGAPILAACAAARSGCGLVALAVPPQVQLAAAASLPEATYLLRHEGQPPAELVEQIIARLPSYQSVVIGPGLGREEPSIELTRGLLSALGRRESPPFVLVDADALYMLSCWPEWPSLLPPGCVLTPHHGEMARLTGLTADLIASRNWEVATEFAVRWRQIVVLKGPHTVVALPDGQAWVYPRANPALATAGSGDTLAGLIAGLAAQGAPAAEAARLGVVAHAQAAERLTSERGWRSLLASDLPPLFPRLLAELRG